MSSELQEKLLNNFPGKMEKRQTFIMQFVMETMSKGEKPPSKDEINTAIDQMIKEGVLQEKDDLLILKKKKTVAKAMEDVEEPVKSTIEVKDYSNYNSDEKMVLESFEGKYENEQALIMQIVMKIARKGEKPPSRDKLQGTIDNMVEKDILARKGANLVKKV